MTNFPPPFGFSDDESGLYDEDDEGERYVRVCTLEGVATREADVAVERAEDEALGNAWFACLKGSFRRASDVNRRRAACPTRPRRRALQGSGKHGTKRANS
jgi:hypothetical protein